MRLAAIMAWAVAGTCATSPTPASEPTESPSDPAGATTPVLQEPEGPPMQATVPLLGGGTLELETLQGRVVLLEFSATDRATWAEAQMRYRGLVERIGEDQVAVVCVASDPEPEALRTYWDRDKPPFTLGWDPQGALALRLGVTALPTAYVLDRRGRKLAEITGAEDYVAQVDALVTAAAGS